MATSPWRRRRFSDCQRVVQTVRESGRLSESRADCQRVGQTVRESGRLSESRADCQRVGQTVTGKNGKPYFSVVTTTFLVKVPHSNHYKFYKNHMHRCSVEWNRLDAHTSLIQEKMEFTNTLKKAILNPFAKLL